MDNLTIALLITLIGMGLVFGGILLLWGVMVLLMRFTGDADSSAEASEAAETDATTTEIPTPQSFDDHDLRRRAAAVAVAYVLSQRTTRTIVPPSPALISAWQAVMRSHQLKQRGQR